MTNYFFIIFILTILCTRLFLFLHPVSGVTIRNFRTHHWMYGIISIFFGLIFHFLLIYGIGLGLFVDELTYLLIRGKNHKDNYSLKSLIGTLIFIILVFVFKNYLVLPFF